MVEYLPLNSDRITEFFTYGISTSFFSVLVCGLLGVTISKLINVMKG